ncbi:hypothetical protein F8388_015726 [Cannabis sativa]|uniref:Ubiquitin-like protease family profile domain-containing protein n=1 Tax=Cannabis sativa TaxID=3483 RepID=A0A7J6I7B8_CANSA|nr:hypothetical protein F8388_015726 [Cannabis sativa]KAF4403055.1 hypothetical protein G4B88_010507 [Cannabis sativa]
MENEINDQKYELASLSYLKEDVKALKALMLENELHPMVIQKCKTTNASLNCKTSSSTLAHKKSKLPISMADHDGVQSGLLRPPKYLRRPNQLRLKDRQVLEYIFSDSKQSDLIVVFGGNYLQRSDFRYLGLETWVESSVITMISLFLTDEERRRSGGCSTIWYLPCRLLIYISILSSNHYCLARVIISLKTVEVWDSLADEKTPVRQSNKIKEILRNLDLAMANQIKKRLSTFSFASFCIRRAQNVPRQPNSFDCGVFVALFMIHRCRLDKRSFEA